jgi:hypothetical protein
MQHPFVTHDFVSPLEVAEAADRQLMGFMDLRAMNESILLELLPAERQEAAELIAPRDPRQRWLAVEEVAQEEASEAVTPASPQEIRAQLLELDRPYRQLSPRAQERVAQEIYRQARQAEKEELAASLTAMDLALDTWTPADAAAAHAWHARSKAQHRAAATRTWVQAELTWLKAIPDGHRLAEVARRAAEAGMADEFTQASAAVRAVLDQRARDIAAGLKAQTELAADRPALYEVANAAMLAGALIGADVLQHLEAALERREAKLSAQAAQAAERSWAQTELAELKAVPDGHRLAEAARRLTKAGLADTFASALAEARRALRAHAFGEALGLRPQIRAAADAAALEQIAETARQMGAAMGAEMLVMEFVAACIAQRQKKLAKEAHRGAQSSALKPLTRAKTVTAQSQRRAAATKACRPTQAPLEVERLLAELRARNPRVAFKNRRARFHALTRVEQIDFVATVLNLQQQIERCWRENAPVVIRQNGLRIIPASELKPGMRLVGLDWMAQKLARAAA